MGVNTKMFIAVEKEAIIKVMPLVIKAINEWQRNDLDRYADSKGFENRMSFLFRDKDAEINKVLKEYSNGIRTCDTYDFRSFNINFTIHGEIRQLFITHNCSNDYSDTYKGDKIIFSLGNWGMSEDIMMVVADAIKEFRYYLRANV